MSFSCICRKIALNNPCFLAVTVLNQNRTNSTTAPISFSKKALKFNVQCITAEGTKTSYEVSKSSLYHELGLTVRDLRFQHENMLTVRNRKVIVRFKGLKAIICTDAVLLIDSLFEPQKNVTNDKVFKFWNNLPQQLTGTSLYTSNLPFEYKAIEAIFMHIVSDLSETLEKIAPDITQLLSVLTDPTSLVVDRSLVHVLLKSSARLNTFGTLVRDLCEIIDELLDCDDDIRDLCVSIDLGEGERSLYDAYIFNPLDKDSGISSDNYTNNNFAPRRIDHKYKINLQDEMEMLLDSFLRDIEDISNKVMELKESIENSNTAILINLDSHRNLLLRLELQLTMGMFSCTLFGMLGMAFGMNLESSWEENPLAFWSVSALMFGGAGIMWKYMLRTLKRSTTGKKSSKDNDGFDNGKESFGDVVSNMPVQKSTNKSIHGVIEPIKFNQNHIRPIHGDLFRMDEFIPGLRKGGDKPPALGNCITLRNNCDTPIISHYRLYPPGGKRLRPLLSNSCDSTQSLLSGRRLYHASSRHKTIFNWTLLRVTC